MGSIVIAPQTKVATMGYVLILLANAVFFIQNPVKSKQYLPLIFLFLISAVISIYVLNCTVVGSCHVYAWIMSYLIGILGILFIFSIIYMVKNDL